MFMSVSSGPLSGSSDSYSDDRIWLDVGHVGRLRGRSDPEGSCRGRRGVERWTMIISFGFYIRGFYGHLL